MYTILILSKPDKFTQSVYLEMHKSAVPENIRWVGYSDFLDLDSIDCDFMSHGRKVIFDENMYAQQCFELGIEVSDNFTVAIVKRACDSISGYFGRIKINDKADASNRLIDLSKNIKDGSSIPDCCLSCLKDVSSIDSKIKVITENKLALLSFIPGLSLYVLGQKTKALIFSGVFVLSAIILTLTIAFQFPEGDVGGSIFLLLAAYFLTMYECDYVCNGGDASWHDPPDIRGLLMLIGFPVMAIGYSVMVESSLWFIVIPFSVGILIYVLITALNKRKYVPLRNFKIIKSNW